jgi:hypothetical protein
MIVAMFMGPAWNVSDWMPRPQGVVDQGRGQSWIELLGAVVQICHALFQRKQLLDGIGAVLDARERLHLLRGRILEDGLRAALRQNPLLNLRGSFCVSLVERGERLCGIARRLGLRHDIFRLHVGWRGL